MVSTQHEQLAQDEMRTATIRFFGTVAARLRAIAESITLGCAPPQSVTLEDIQLEVSTAMQGVAVGLGVRETVLRPLVDTHNTLFAYFGRGGGQVLELARLGFTVTTVVSEPAARIALEQQAQSESLAITVLSQNPQANNQFQLLYLDCSFARLATSAARISALQMLSNYLVPEGMIVLSVGLLRGKAALRIAKLARFIAWLSRNPRAVEIGDRIIHQTRVHYFTRQSLNEELAALGAQEVDYALDASTGSLTICARVAIQLQAQASPEAINNADPVASSVALLMLPWRLAAIIVQFFTAVIEGLHIGLGGTIVSDPATATSLGYPSQLRPFRSWHGRPEAFVIDQLLATSRTEKRRLRIIGNQLPELQSNLERQGFELSDEDLPASSQQLEDLDVEVVYLSYLYLNQLLTDAGLVETLQRLSSLNGDRTKPWIVCYLLEGDETPFLSSVRSAIARLVTWLGGTKVQYSAALSQFSGVPVAHHSLQRIEQLLVAQGYSGFSRIPAPTFSKRPGIFLCAKD